ncbi:hypothetical protein F503_08082 [Ophiostoma piceae UAMH 11346]|uniref:Uncharacterized protein n=1 Tax=Ophiostoma piceae (strain UAMH 11346) TaxID=1262450 RepID=S3C6B8_OPHP1|nr:hypothetical protein F503_08082 [Ophiostoma piceae UAMH 11346]
MGEDSLMVSPTRGEDDVDIPMCESPISQAPSPLVVQASKRAAVEEPAARRAAKPEPEPEPRKPTAPPSPLLPAPPPRVTTVVPASFVPIESDWSLPLAAASEDLSKSAHAQVMLGTLEYYHTGVRKGIMHLASLDQKRILLAQAEADRAEKAAQAAREERTRQLQRAQEVVTGLGIMEPAAPGATKATASITNSSAAPGSTTAPVDGDFIPPAELDDMISAMRAPALPGIDYNVPTEAMMQALPIQFPSPAVGEKPGGRRDHIRQYNEVAEQAIMQLAGFGVHMNQQRARWMAVIERETAAAAEQESKDKAKPASSPPQPPPPPLDNPPLRDPQLRQQEDTEMTGN